MPRLLSRFRAVNAVAVLTMLCGGVWYTHRQRGSQKTRPVTLEYAPSLAEGLPPPPVFGVRPNVLLLVVDDLRGDLGPFHDTHPAYNKRIHTPNIDHLASTGFVLKQTYTAYAVCDPSRTSLLTSRRPDTTRVYHNHRYFRSGGSNLTSLPQYFKEHGYTSVGIGKVFHLGEASGHDDPPSWSGDIPSYTAHQIELHRFWKHLRHSCVAVTPSLRARHPLPDGITASRSPSSQHSLPDPRPFFLAVGFKKPHASFTFPKRFADFYGSPESTSLPERQVPPDNAPLLALPEPPSLVTMFNDLPKCKNNTFPPRTVRHLRRAYYSAVSYIDSLIGQVLDEVSSLGLADNTIVVLASDHGCHLGENGMWGKRTNYDLDIHVPLILRLPGLTKAGDMTSALTELVDVFPTLVEAAGLPSLQLCPDHHSHAVALCTEGVSLIPLLTQPQRPWKDAVFTYSTRGGTLAYSIRTAQFKYMEWTPFDVHRERRPSWSRLLAAELYDLEYDPLETANVADDWRYRETRSELRHRLHAGWRKALPA